MKNKGFTLVELLAVIAILAILVIIALPNVLKMFNDSKKNSFLTEAKTIYSEVSKKYISESMKGNKLTYVSSEDDTKLDMTGKSLKYCVLLNADGSVKSMKVSNGEWIAELPSGKKITDLKSSDLKAVPSGYKFECKAPLPAKSFDEDSWEVIASNAENCTDNPDSCPYSVGDEKEVDVGKYGTHKESNSMEICKFMNLPIQHVHFDSKGEYIIIKTLEGDMRADIGDYIIKGVSGEFYPCKPDIFEKTYEPIIETD